MTDLSRVLPHFPLGQFARLIPVLEKHDISTSDLLTLEAADIGKRTRLPLLDIRRLCGAVLGALHADLGVSDPPPAPPVRDQHSPSATPGPGPGQPCTLKNTPASLSSQWQTISTLDPDLDRALGGGIPAGSVTEITGESGAGKTQFLLTLLLAVQLPPPHGLGRPALYISTEAPLSTRRLAQMLSANPLFQRLPPSERPSLDAIISTVTPDLESQDHIVTFQVPVEVERRRIGLVVLDSVAANYRAEFERSAGRHGSNMGARTAELIKLGMHLRDLAQRHNLAVVVSNQVADRFAGGPITATPASLRPHFPRQTQESPLASRSLPAPPHQTHSRPDPDTDPPSSVPLPSSSIPLTQQQQQQQPPTAPLPLLLDHQQRWFTGWGDDDHPSISSSPSQPLKTPSLGLVWATQIAARIALIRRRRPPLPLPPPPPPHHHPHHSHSDTPANPPRHTAVSAAAGTWERHMKVVFASHAAAAGPGLAGAVGFEVWMGGVRATGRDGSGDE